MSTLTKIFVVLLVVFSIAFTMAAISFVAQSSDWRKLARGYQTEAQATDAHLRNVLASSAAELAAARDQNKSLMGRYKGLEGDYQDALQKVAELEAELAEARAEVSSLQATTSVLAGELKVGQAGWQEVRDQRDSMERRNLELEKRNLDLSQRVNEQIGKLTVLQREKRNIEEQLQMLQEEGRRYGQYRQQLQQGDVRSMAQAPQESVRPMAPPATATPIRGQVKEVSGNLATVSVGSADGVVEGMMFVVYRGQEYIGDLRIEMVDANESAGRVVRSRGKPRVGDRVADETRMGLSG